MDPRQCAIYYLEQEALGRAEKLLREWVLTHPDDIYIHMELIRCFYNRRPGLNSWGDCDQFYQQVYDRPNAKGVRSFVRGEQLQYENREEESLLHYKAAVDAGLDAPTLHHCHAMVLKALGRNVEAKAEYETALSQDPRFLPGLVIYGRMLSQEGRFDRLEKILAPAEDLNSQSPEYRFRHEFNGLERINIMKEACVVLRESVRLAQAGKMRDAIGKLWPVFVKQTNNCWFVRTVVFLFYRANWLLYGKKKLEEVLDSDSPILSYANGLIHWRQDKHEEALQAYDAAIAKGLEHALVRCDRALAYEALKREEERERDLVAAFSGAPWCIYSRANLARLRYKQGNLDEVDVLAQVDRGEYECAEVYDVSGKQSIAKLEVTALSSLLKQKKGRMALDRMREQPVPDEDGDLCFRRSMVFAENREFGDAASELTKSIKLNYQVVGTKDESDKRRLHLIMDREPGCFGVAFARALLPAFEDKLEDAKDNLEQLVNEFPSEQDVWYHLANVSSLLGDRLRAKEACGKALAVERGCQGALHLLCTLLKQDGDVQGLRELTTMLDEVAAPLEYALQWAESNKQPQVAKQIASELLAIDPANEAAVCCLMEGLDPESPEYAGIAEHWATLIPLDFGARILVARTLLLSGKPEEALQRYDSVFLDGLDSIQSVLMHGLAYLAAEGVQKKREE